MQLNWHISKVNFEWKLKSIPVKSVNAKNRVAYKKKRAVLIKEY